MYIITTKFLLECFPSSFSVYASHMIVNKHLDEYFTKQVLNYTILQTDDVDTGDSQNRYHSDYFRFPFKI